MASAKRPAPAKRCELAAFMCRNLDLISLYSCNLAVRWNNKHPNAGVFRTILDSCAETVKTNARPVPSWANLILLSHHLCLASCLLPSVTRTKILWDFLTSPDHFIFLNLKTLILRGEDKEQAQKIIQWDLDIHVSHGRSDCLVTCLRTELRDVQTEPSSEHGRRRLFAVPILLLPKHFSSLASTVSYATETLIGIIFGFNVMEKDVATCKY
jgi:hypothetical protein